MEQWNYSNISSDDQEKLLNELQARCSQDEYLCHLLFFLYACQQPGKKKYLIIEKEEYINTFNQYVERISPDSTVLLVPVNEELELFKDAVDHFLLEQKKEGSVFDLIMYPAWFGNEAILSFIEILAPKGKIIIHGQSNGEVSKELRLEREINSGQSSFLAFEDNRNIIPAAKKMIVDIMAEIKNSDINSEANILELIRKVSNLEEYIQKNRDTQKIHSYCYYINEIKNALLDVYVGKANRDKMICVLFELLESIEL